MATDLVTTKAIVSHNPVNGKRQWILEDIAVGPPEENEAIVEIVASGICHTDLGCGTDPDGTPGFPVPPYPRVLGHEGSGYVKAIGSKVTKVKLGDAVLLSFAFCTECHNCRFGAPGYCARFNEINFTGNKSGFKEQKAAGDRVGGSFFGQSSFSRLTRVQETSIVKATNLIKGQEDLKLFAPLGCGIQTGAGTVTELAKAGPNDKVAIIGLGGVGLAAIMVGSFSRPFPEELHQGLTTFTYVLKKAAKLRGCPTIIGIDRVPARLELARSLGATAGIDTSTISGSLVDEVRQVTGGSGSTITVDATGVVPLIQQGIEFTANQGKMILLGVAPMTSKLDLSIVPYMVASPL
ncbi:hypothetical protein NW759_017027 [Fusarium solani]|nr:hypothetical protein NW759_017027 [Fusarium solani]